MRPCGSPSLKIGVTPFEGMDSSCSQAFQNHKHVANPCHTHTCAMHVRHTCTLSRMRGPQEPSMTPQANLRFGSAPLPGGARGKEPARAGDTRDAGSIPGSGGCPGAGHGNPLQYSCLENPIDRGNWWATYSP